MTIDEIEKRLTIWMATVKAVDEQYESFSAMTDCMPDCDLWNPVFAMESAYTALVSEAVGDTGDWLNWFNYENDFGAKSLHAGNGNKITKIKTLRQLARLIHNA